MVHESQLGAIGEILADCAMDIFNSCGAAGDFCVQHIGAFNVVFGGTNRLIWSPANGWRIDREHCTPNFAATFDSLWGKGDTL